MAVECRYRGRVIGCLYTGADGYLAYRRYWRPSREDTARAQMQMNDPNPFSRLGGYGGPNPFRNSGAADMTPFALWPKS